MVMSKAEPKVVVMVAAILGIEGAFRYERSLGNKLLLWKSLPPTIPWHASPFV